MSMKFTLLMNVKILKIISGINTTSESLKQEMYLFFKI